MLRQTFSSGKNNFHCTNDYIVIGCNAIYRCRVPAFVYEILAKGIGRYLRFAIIAESWPLHPPLPTLSVFNRSDVSFTNFYQPFSSKKKRVADARLVGPTWLQFRVNRSPPPPTPTFVPRGSWKEGAALRATDSPSRYRNMEIFRWAAACAFEIRGIRTSPASSPDIYCRCLPAIQIT